MWVQTFGDPWAQWKITVIVESGSELCLSCAELGRKAACPGPERTEVVDSGSLWPLQAPRGKGLSLSAFLNASSLQGSPRSLAQNQHLKPAVNVSRDHTAGFFQGSARGHVHFSQHLR